MYGLSAATPVACPVQRFTPKSLRGRTRASRFSGVASCSFRSRKVELNPKRSVGFGKQGSSRWKGVVDPQLRARKALVVRVRASGEDLNPDAREGKVSPSSSELRTVEDDVLIAVAGIPGPILLQHKVDGYPHMLSCPVMGLGFANRGDCYK